MPPEWVAGVTCRIGAELAGAETEMTEMLISLCVCPALGGAVGSEDPRVPGGDGSSIRTSSHTGRLTDDGIKWCCIILGVPSVVRNLNSRVA